MRSFVGSFFVSSNDTLLFSLKRLAVISFPRPSKQGQPRLAGIWTWHANQAFCADNRGYYWELKINRQRQKSNANCQFRFLLGKQRHAIVDSISKGLFISDVKKIWIVLSSFFCFWFSHFLFHFDNISAFYPTAKLTGQSIVTLQ